MAFASIEFILFFLLVFFAYWVLCAKNKNMQNGLIVLASLFFYGTWDWRCLGLLLLTALSTWCAGVFLVRRNASNKARKRIAIAVILLNLGILFFFKYFNFFIQSFTDLFGLFGKDSSCLSPLKIILPIGISFYTFTALSYTIDVYKRKIEATNDILAYFAYVTFFPALLCGPISRADKQLPQYYQKRVFAYERAISACKLLLWGALMKYCLADRVGIYVDAVYGNLFQHNGTTLLLTSILYSIQIYADFAGYSLMALGIGRLFGIELQLNFDRPYMAKTVTEFWRRWHISLTTWFRDYIYFPLGGNRVKHVRWMLNTMIVFVISGLWHGANYTFLIWGAMHGVFMIIERELYGQKIKQIEAGLSFANIIRMLFTFCIVTIAWVFFRSDSVGDAVYVVRSIFSSYGVPFIDSATMVYAFLFILIVFLHDYKEEFCKSHSSLLNADNVVVRWGAYVIIIVLVLLFGVFDGSSFIYFQF